MTVHAERPTPLGAGKTYCACGQPWPCPQDDENDPEMLQPTEKIRYAEQLIRRERRVLDEDYLFWGNLADYFNDVANLPGRLHRMVGGGGPGEWRRFNRAQDMATGYIRMSANREISGELREARQEESER